jgi:M6 family metalloprotease-like protein
MSKKNGKLLGRFAPILAVALALLGAGVPEVAVAATELAPDPMPPHPDLRELANRGLIALPDAVTSPELRRLLGINEAEGPFPVQPSGSWRALALLVQFTDNPATVGASSFDSLLFSAGTGTLRDYYDQVSYGILDIVTVNLPSAIGWMTMPQTYAYYVNGANGFGTYPQNAQRLAEDAVWAANPVVDYSQYDNDSDGWVDSLFIIHAGPGAEFTGNPNHIWSHKWSMVNDPFADGVGLNGYTMEPEYWASPGDMTVGVYAHEMAHALGLPDLYDIDGSTRGIGSWGLMGGGSWNGSLGDSPAWPSAWSRAYLGWVTPTSLAADMPGASIPAAETSQTVFRLWTNGSTGDEYFLVENRQAIGYDAQLPGFGLLIWHIDENKTGNDSECDQLDNWNCGAAHLLVALEQADGLWDLEHDTDGGDPGDPFPGTTNSFHFDFGTVPNSSSYYTSLATCVAVSNIGPSSPTMVADLGVACVPLSVGPVVYDSYLVDDDNLGNSSGNADGFVDCGETVASTPLAATGTSGEAHPLPTSTTSTSPSMRALPTVTSSPSTWRSAPPMGDRGPTPSACRCSVSHQMPSSPTTIRPRPRPSRVAYRKPTTSIRSVTRTG